LVDTVQRHPLPESPHRPNIVELSSAFHPPPVSGEPPPAAAPAGSHGTGPGHVQFLVLAARRSELTPIRASLDSYGNHGRQWCPYRPACEKSIGALVQSVAAAAGLNSGAIAIACFEEQRDTARERGDHRSEGIALANLGTVDLNLGQRTRAMACFEEHLATARQFGNRSDEGEALRNLGIASTNLGETERAISCYEQSLASTREGGDRLGEGRALGNLGNAYADLGQTHRAIACFRKHRELAREVGDHRGEANACWNLGLALEELGRLADAVSFLEDCVAFEQEIGHPDASLHAARVEKLRRRSRE
jgi:tetratricopeptide (TPR) repeat protein